jgi:phosphonopyruvate decarboxylase
MPYEIGVVVIMSMRGWPDPAADEPQHAVMGRCTSAMLKVLGVATWELPLDSTAGHLEAALAGAVDELSRGRPAFILLARGVVAADDAASQQPAQRYPGAGERLGVIRLIRPLLQGIPVVATTGYTARDLFASGDDDHHFYMQGSMGHAAAVAFGLARHRQAAGSGPVVILDGDGALLMHLGTLSTIGASRPVPLVHLVFDNGCYESTGGQPTTSATADFTAVALACGYQTACVVTGDAQLTTVLGARLAADGPHLIVVPTRPATGLAPPRATSALPPPAIFRRFAAAATGAGRAPTGGHPG